MASPLQVGIAGFGISARVFHAPFLARMPEYRLHTVWERKGPRAPEVYPGVRSVQDAGDLLSDPGIDLVVITTPNETHFDLASRALRNGKHVVLEKPFTNTSAEAAELMRLAKESGRVLSVYHNRRYVSDFLTIKELLAEGLLGNVHEYEAHYDRYRPEARPNAWREEPLEGSGILYDLGPHIMDQALCLFGLPQSIYADIRLQRPHARAVDYFDLQLYYPDKKVILKSGMLVREPGPRYMIHGNLGSFLKYGEDPQEAKLRAGIAPGGPGWGEEAPEYYGLLHTERAGKVIQQRYPSTPGNYALYYQHLYETIALGAPLRETPAHGYNTIRLIELALASNVERAAVEVTGMMAVSY